MSTTPKFKKGQVVWWGNGKGIYVQIYEVLPPHCPGAAQTYEVRPVRRAFREFYFPESHRVSEGVLSKLTMEEIGL